MGGCVMFVLNIPFMNRFAYGRADRGKPWVYMALFTSRWSVAHIIVHTLRIDLISWSTIRPRAGSSRVCCWQR
jgi:hypothetical protein